MRRQSAPLKRGGWCGPGAGLQRIRAAWSELAAPVARPRLRRSQAERRALTCTQAQPIDAASWQASPLAERSLRRLCVCVCVCVHLLTRPQSEARRRALVPIGEQRHNSQRARRTTQWLWRGAGAAPRGAAAAAAGNSGDTTRRKQPNSSRDESTQCECLPYDRRVGRRRRSGKSCQLEPATSGGRDVA